MSVDLQNVAVFVIVLAAFAYVARRGWARVRGMWRRGGADSSCATGCGSCGGEERAPQVRATPLVQIGRAKQNGRARTR
jgi:hypothetical protein